MNGQKIIEGLEEAVSAEQTDIVKRLEGCHLEYVEGIPCGYGEPINPDGPEGAAEIRSLRAALAAAEERAEKAETLLAVEGKRFEAVSALLAQAKEALGPFISDDMRDMMDCEDNDGNRYQSGWLSDAIERANAALSSIQSSEGDKNDR